MGSFPKIKRRCLAPGVVTAASILSALILYTFLFSQPAYLQRIPDALLPSHEPESGQWPSAEGKHGAEAEFDTHDNPSPINDVAQTAHTVAPMVDVEAIEVATSTSASTRVLTATKTAIPMSTSTKGWKYDTTRDSTAYALDTEQCQSAFPGLFEEIERGVATRKELGNITAEQMDISTRMDGALHAMILDQKLYILQETVLNNPYDTSRALAILHAIHRAIVTSPEPLPNTEFSFTVADVVPDPEGLRYPIWGLARKHEDEEIWLMSDFGYWSWPLDLVGGYDEVRREITESEIDFSKKKKQCVWRGAVATNGHREELIRATEGKEWADVKAIVWAGVSEISPEDNDKALSMPQHCQYQFVIHTEGHSYSGRGKYLQNCNSVVVMHKRTWVEPHHSLLISEGPEQNFVEVEEDFSDLEEKITELLDDPKRAEQIALNGVKTFRDRYLTPAAQACYWRELLRGWGGVSFEPEAWDVNEEDKTRTIRGVPFETFVLQSVIVEPGPAKCRWLGKFLGQC